MTALLGWCAWALLTLLAFVAGGCVALRLFPERGLLHRATAAVLVTVALLVTVLQAAGLLALLRPLPLGLLALLLFGGTALVAMWPLRGQLRARLRHDLRAALGSPKVNVLDLPWFASWALGLAIVGAVLERVWYFKTWGWDAAWYHVPITDFTLQNGSLAWIDSPVTSVQGFPRNVELLAVWNCIFPRDNRLDDSPQLVFLLLGVLLLAAWARRLGVSRSMALGLGPLWLSMPPIFLEAPHNGNDIACGVLLACFAYFLLDGPRRANRYLAFAAAGLYVGSKYTAVLHMALLAPLVLVWLWREGRAAERRWRWLGDVALSLGLACWLGLVKYAQNALHTGNPFFPMDMTVPVLHWHFAGTYFPSSMDYIPFAEDPRMRLAGGHYAWFFSRPADFTKMVTTWFDAHPFLEPNVHTGGFGAIFRWLLLPCLGLAAVQAVLGRARRETLWVLGLFGVAIIVPAAYWPRYIVAASVASVLALALVWSSLQQRVARLLLGLAALGLGLGSFQSAFAGGVSMAQYRAELRRLAPHERANVQVADMLWPFELAQLRDRELGEGEVLAFDESAYFESDLFSPDFHTRVVHVPTGELSTYLPRLRAAHARWAIADHRAAGLLRSAGAELIRAWPPVSVYRLPPSFAAGDGHGSP